MHTSKLLSKAYYGKKSWYGVLLFVTVLINGCSGASSSGNSNGDDSLPPVADSVSVNTPEPENAPESEASLLDPNLTGSDSVETTIAATTRVTLNITVPAYQSDALQVRVAWGQIDTVAAWVVDESWTLTEDFPANTEHRLFVTFADNNGQTILGTVDQVFATGSEQQTLDINVSQFDTTSWDADSDGVSNLEESRAGTDPLMDDVLQEVQASIELVANSIFRIRWQPVAGAQTYRVMENADGQSEYLQLGEDINSTVELYDHNVSDNGPSLLFERLNARYLVQACNSTGCVESNELSVSNLFETGLGYVVSSNFELEDDFGSDISLSADGNTLAVGARTEKSTAAGINADQLDNSGFFIGAVYVFVRIGNTWQQQAYVKASDADNSFFGSRVGLSADGNTMVVSGGGIYIFERTNGDWRESEQFPGHRSVISADGNVVAAEGPGLSDEVNVFARRNGQWQQEATLRASFSGSDDFFGNSLSLNADGTTLAIGADLEDSGATGIDGNESDNSAQNSGAVFVFARTNDSWQQQAYLKASNAETDDQFGTRLSISADGNTLAVAATHEDSFATGVNGDQADNFVRDSGAVYVFQRQNSNWQQQAYLKASNTAREDWFGSDLSLNAAGDTLVVSAIGSRFSSADPRAGQIYFFRRNNESWQQQAYLTASDDDTVDLFGDELSRLSSDGNTLAVAVPRYGAIYIYSSDTGLIEDIANTGPVTDSAETEIRDIFSIGPSGFFSFHPYDVESQIPTTRPYFEQTELLPPEILASGMINPDRWGLTQMLIIDLDASGTGTFSDNREERSPAGRSTRFVTTANRTNTGGSMQFMGTLTRFHSESGAETEFEITTETQVTDTGMRFQTGTLVDRYNNFGGYLGQRRTITYELTGSITGNSRDCEAVAGRLTLENMPTPSGPLTEDLDIITASKTIEDEHWTVTVTDLDGRFRNEFLARRLLTNFYCDYPELRQ